MAIDCLFVCLFVYSADCLVLSIPDYGIKSNCTQGKMRQSARMVLCEKEKGSQYTVKTLRNFFFHDHIGKWTRTVSG